MEPFSIDPVNSQQIKVRLSKRLCIQRYLRFANRLIHMSVSEIVQRLYIIVRKRIAIGIPGSKSAKERRHKYSRTFLDHFSFSPRHIQKACGQFNERFFFGPSQQAVLSACINEHFPIESRRIILAADAIGKQGINILGQRVQFALGKVDWHVDPQTKRRAWPEGELDEGEAINVADADVKYVWEVNRHQFLTFLGRAFWLTNDPRYAHAVVILIQDWIAKNPIGCGINWSSSLEVAVRAISWLWTMPYVLAWSEVDPRFLEHWLGGLAEHFHYLSEHLSIYTDPTNHLIGEATALWMLSVVFPDLPGAFQYGSHALDILAREVERQITPDGVNREQATSYHRFVLDFYIQLLVLARRIRESLPAVFEQRVQAMLEFVAALIGDRGMAPMIGDSDDARGVPFLELSGWDFRDLLSTGAVLFERPEWKKLSGGLAEVTVWLLGAEAIEKYNSLPVASLPCTSRVFSHGGYCFFRASTSHTQLELIFDVGPLGLWPNAAHGHADALSILIRMKGGFFLTDPGTGTYFGSRFIRDAFRHTSAHNTLTVDDLDQADIYDTFKWVNPMNVCLIESFIGEHFDYAKAMHDGYNRLRKSIVHYRLILFIRPLEWIIIDHLEGKGEHLYSRHFHFPPGINLQWEGAQSIIAIDQTTGDGLQFSFPEIGESETVSLQFDNGGVWSERYGQWEKAPRLKVEIRGSAPLTLFTFINPIADHAAYSLNTSRCFTESFTEGHAVLCRRVRIDLDSCSEEMVLVNPMHLDLDLPGGLRSNAGFLFLRQFADGSIERAFLSGENQYLFDGTSYLMSEGDEQFSSFVR
jgi:uncharacterized heparinase superfamily protein